MTTTTDELPPLAPPSCSAVFPLDVSGPMVKDATGANVLICSEDRECGTFWNEKQIDVDPHFICPTCGRLGQRMVEIPKTYGAYHLHPDGWYRLFSPNVAVTNFGANKTP